MEKIFCVKTENDSGRVQSRSDKHVGLGGAEFTAAIMYFAQHMDILALLSSFHSLPFDCCWLLHPTVSWLNVRAN